MTSTDGVHEFLSDGNTQNVDTPDHCRGSDPEMRIESKFAAWKSSSCIIRRLPSKDQAEQEALAQRQQASQQQIVHEGLAVHAIKTDARLRMILLDLGHSLRAVESSMSS